MHLKSVNSVDTTGGLKRRLRIIIRLVEVAVGLP